MVYGSEKKRTLLTSALLSHYVTRNARFAANKATPSVNDRANDPTHLAPPSALIAPRENPHLAVGPECFHQTKPRSCHLLACFTRLLSANTMLDPGGSFQLSGRSPIRCRSMKGRMHARSLARARVPSTWPRGTTPITRKGKS